MTCSVIKSDEVRIQSFIARTFSTSLYGKLWEHVVKISFFLRMKYGYNDVVILKSSWHLHQPTDVFIMQIIDDDVVRMYHSVYSTIHFNQGVSP